MNPAVSGSAYRFETVWHVAAPCQAVWDAIYASDRWPEWWRGVEEVVEVAAGSTDGIGNVRRYSWQGVLPYRLTFEVRTTCIEHLTRLAGIASGDLAGTGTWLFAGDDGGTTVSYLWQVSLNRRWLLLLEPLAWPLYRWNHDKIMAWGAEGLSGHLGAPVRTITT